MFRIPLNTSGSLWIVARPRGGDWLDDDVSAMAQTGISVLVSLLRHDEQTELGLELEADACSRHAVQFVSLPVPDRGTPNDPGQFAGAVHRLTKSLRDGGSVAVHCRQSVGRS